MRELRHDNLNSFIGAIIEAPNISVLFVYCARGNLEVCVTNTTAKYSINKVQNSMLQDVIKNKDLDLDNMFVASLVADLLKVCCRQLFVPVAMLHFDCR